MKKILFSAIALAVSLAGYAQWKPAGDKIKTTWAEQIDPNNVLPEYPRPIMERKEWKNLNGLWEYAIRPTGTQQPADMDGQILVPFAVESSLSGVMKTLGKENELWYSREFTVPSSWKGKNILLHFGAVDWQADVWVNGVKMGQHRGGYTPFSFDKPDHGKSMGSERRRLSTERKTGETPGRYLVHSGQRNLANGMDGTCIRQPHHPAENDTGYR